MKTSIRLPFMIAATLCIAFAFDASQSTIYGIASADTLIINQTYTLTVQAKDASGNNLVTGGEDIYVHISDPCTRGINMSCVPSAFTQSATNGGEKVQKLTDNADGTYTTSFDLNHIGDATLSVFQVVSEQIVNQYYNNQVISGTPDVTNTSADINFSWSGDITPGHGDVAARFTGKLTPFQTGAYTLSLYQDNGSTLRINGVELISKFDTNWFGTDTVSYNFNAFETYEVQVDWIDFGGPGGVKLSWNFGSGSIFIPADNYATSSDIGSSPLQISVSCPTKYEQVPSTTDQCRPKCGDGFVIGSEVCDDKNTADGDGCKSDCTAVEASWVCSGGSDTTQSVCTECTQGFYQNNPSNPTACVTQCGDGYRVGAEVCDDNNINDGDGCKSDCSEIEENYACNGGSSSSKDTCELCQSGFIPDTNKESCITVCGDSILAGQEICDDGNTIKGDGCATNCNEVEVGWTCDQASPTICKRDYKSVPLTDGEKAMQATTLSIIPIVVGLNVIGGMVSQSSRNSALSSINQLQLLMLLLLLEIYIPLRVINYLRSLSSSLVNINIDWSFFIVFKKMSEWFDYPQERADFDMIDISSGSSLLNLNTMIGTFINFVLIHILVSIFARCNKKSHSLTMRLARYIKKCLTYEMYIVLIFEGFIALCLCSFSEFGRFRISASDAETRSFPFAIAFFVLIIVVIIFVATLWILAKTTNPDSNKSFVHEFFSGMKPKKAARLQPLMFFIRRAILCLMITLLRDLDRPIFLGLYLGVNCVHCALICVIRPFEKVTDNITEIINELFYVSFCLFLQWHYLEDQWSYTKGVVYYWSLAGNNIVNALFSLGVFIYTMIVQKSRKKRLEILNSRPIVTQNKLHPKSSRKPEPSSSLQKKLNRIKVYPMRKETDKSMDKSLQKLESMFSGLTQRPKRPELNISNTTLLFQQ